MQQYNSAQQLSIARGRDFMDMDAESAHARSLSSLNIPSVAFLASHKERSEAFQENVEELDELIANLTANLHLDGVKNSKDKEFERLQKEQAEQRRIIAIAERAARQKEAQARDPHKKVELKLENTRKFGKDFLETIRIPMQQVDFVGDAGVDHISMVDVVQIRQRCKQISDGATPSVESLIDELTRMDRLHGYDPKTGKPPAGSRKDDEKPEPPADQNAQSAMSPGGKQSNAPTSPLSTTGKSAVSPVSPKAQMPISLTEEKRAKVASQKSMAFVPMSP
jgi:hypothetical protein